jgi:hypothetical protein
MPDDIFSSDQRVELVPYSMVCLRARFQAEKGGDLHPIVSRLTRVVISVLRMPHIQEAVSMIEAMQTSGMIHG